jgi:DNA-binding NarL/FixJ family response regulator
MDRAPRIEAIEPWKLYAVPLGELAVGGEMHRPLAPWEFASFDAFSRNCPDAQAARRLLGPSFGHTAAEIELGRRATIQYYGANSNVHATAIAIERGDIVIRDGKPEPPPPPPLEKTLDYLAEGLSTVEIAVAMSTSPETIQRYYRDIRSFYGKAVNLSSALRRACEWGHKKFPYVGLAAKPLTVDVTPVEVQILKGRSLGLTNARIAESMDGLSEKTLKTWITRLLDKLKADNAAEAIAKTIVLGIDLGLTFDAKPHSALSERERQVAVGICLGLSNEKIATQLTLSVNTVKTHIKRLWPKFYEEKDRDDSHSVSRDQIVRYMFDAREVVVVPLPEKPSLPRQRIPRNSGRMRPGRKPTIQ